MHRKQLAAILIAIALTGGALWYGSAHRSDAGAERITAASVSVPILQAETVLDAMKADAAITFDGEEYPSLGFFVDSINGKKGADGYYWTLYINGTESELGASSARVGPGDSVEWRYEKGTY